MKECKDCEYFDGYNYDDGTPKCCYSDGYENCPYCQEGEVKEDKFKIILDIPDITKFIKHTVTNTVEKSVLSIIIDQVNDIIKEEIKNIANEYVEESLKKAIDSEIASFMKKDITIGGGWREPERKISRETYLSECVESILKDKLSPEQTKKIVTEYCSNAISSNIDRLKNDINRGIKNNFDETTRKALSENVVSMLMAGDTYQRLSSSMERLLK